MRETREYFNKGTCRTLKGNPYIVFMFIDDEVSSWNQKAIHKYWFNHVEEAVKYLEDSAKDYHVDLKIDRGLYSSCEKNMHVKYNGIIKTDVMKKEYDTDILDQAAESLGFPSKNEMHEYLKNYTGKDQIAYVIIVNKKGTSYAMDHSQGGNDHIEHCVVFNSNRGYTVNYSTAALVHELLHLFGGEDYYDPYNRYPKRKIIAEQIYPKDIMLTVFPNVRENVIGPYTAYTIGWTDTLPNECVGENWWK